MEKELGETSPSTIDVVINRALADIAGAVKLELVEVIQSLDLLDKVSRSRLAKLGEQLIRISQGSGILMGDESAQTLTETRVLSLETTTELPKPIVTLPNRELQPIKSVALPKASTVEQPSIAGGLLREKGSSTVETETKTEKNNLYTGIVSLELLPTMALKEGAPSATVSILNGNSLGIGGRNFALKGHELYLFNALLLLRDKARTAEELRAFNFAPNCSNGTARIAFNKSMRSLSSKLNGAAGLELVKQLGQTRGTRYVVNPNLVLEDFRTDEDKKVENGNVVKKK